MRGCEGLRVRATGQPPPGGKDQKERKSLLIATYTTYWGREQWGIKLMATERYTLILIRIAVSNISKHCFQRIKAKPWKQTCCVCVTAVTCAMPGKKIKTYNKMDQHFKICIILKAQILVLIPYVLEVYIWAFLLRDPESSVCHQKKQWWGSYSKDGMTHS